MLCMYVSCFNVKEIVLSIVKHVPMSLILRYDPTTVMGTGVRPPLTNDDASA